MRFLLDTHVWLWSIIAPQNMTPATLAVIGDSQHSLYLSPISVWEAMLLIERGRIEVDAPPADWLRNALSITPVTEAALTNAIALRSRLIELPHQDPTDRFIAATALEYDLILMTADGYLLDQKDLTVWKVT